MCSAMRMLIIGIGCLLGGLGCCGAYISVGQSQEKMRNAAYVQTKIMDLKQKISVLKELDQQPALGLDTAYASLVNDMHVLARAHRAAFTMSFPEARDTGIQKSAIPSLEFPGLRQMAFRGTFSGISRAGILLSLLDGLSCLQQELPVLLRELHQEKDILTIDLVLIGP